MSNFLSKFKSKLLYKLNTFKASRYTNNLDELGRIFHTDKVDGHHYTQHYATHFYPLKNKNLNILEIGVGGYKKSYKGGHSLRMWKKYFPKANIYSLDIYDKSDLEEKRIKIFKGSQIDEKVLEEIFYEAGTLDIIIDDGSHINEHVITTFKYLFPKLENGGIYVVEDVQTSYWEDHGGDSKNLQNPTTSMNFFKSLTDGLNYQEFLIEGYQPTYFDKHITSIHFYHNLIFIYKGDNNELSNAVKDHKRIDGGY